MREGYLRHEENIFKLWEAWLASEQANWAKWVLYEGQE